LGGKETEGKWGIQDEMWKTTTWLHQKKLKFRERGENKEKLHGERDSGGKE